MCWIRETFRARENKDPNEREVDREAVNEKESEKRGGRKERKREG